MQKTDICKPGLYVVGVPIGNMEDITYRAVRTLASVDTILCEDTRTTQQLLRHYNITKKSLHICNAHTESEKISYVRTRISEGKSLALVSDAGMPCVSDPGSRLIAACHKEQIPVYSVPGPSSVTTAIALSGCHSEGFFFGGFLPNRPAQREAVLKETSSYPVPIVFFEAPHRIQDTLKHIATLFPERHVHCLREMTKVHETIHYNTLYTDVIPKGEHVLILEPYNRKIPFKIEEALLSACSMLPLKQACLLLHTLTGISKKTLYTMGLNMKR